MSSIGSSSKQQTAAKTQTSTSHQTGSKNEPKPTPTKPTNNATATQPASPESKESIEARGMASLSRLGDSFVNFGSIFPD